MLARAQLTRFPEQNATRSATFALLDEVVRGLEGIRPLDSQPEVDVAPTYKTPLYFDAKTFGGLSLNQLAACYEYLLGCEFARIYEPLTRSPLYQPQSDTARRISEKYWAAIQPARYYSPNAHAAYRQVLAIEHGAGLDPAFPDRFAKATGLIRRDLRRVTSAFDA